LIRFHPLRGQKFKKWLDEPLGGGVLDLTYHLLNPSDHLVLVVAVHPLRNGSVATLPDLEMIRGIILDIDADTTILNPDLECSFKRRFTFEVHGIVEDPQPTLEESKHDVSDYPPSVESSHSGSNQFVGFIHPTAREGLGKYLLVFSISLGCIGPLRVEGVSHTGIVGTLHPWYLGISGFKIFP
jgi:hypothetical protein